VEGTLYLLGVEEFSEPDEWMNFDALLNLGGLTLEQTPELLGLDFISPTTAPVVGDVKFLESDIMPNGMSGLYLFSSISSIYFYENTNMSYQDAWEVVQNLIKLGKLSDEESAATIFESNTAPVVEITSPSDGDSVPVSQLIQFEGVISDAEEAPNLLSVQWTCGGSIFNTTSSTAEGALVAPFQIKTLGPTTIGLVVEDSSGATTLDSIEVTVIP